MLRVSQTKASRTEMNGVVQLVNKLYKRIKTLSIWCVEMARSMLPQVGKGGVGGNGEEEIQHLLNRRQYLLRQSQLAQKWIHEYGSVINSFDCMQDERDLNEMIIIHKNSQREIAETIR